MSLTNAQIVSEVNSDPAALGYAAFVAVKNAVAVADILNWIRNGTTPCPDNNVVGAAITVFRNDIEPKEIVNAIAPEEDGLAATQCAVRAGPGPAARPRGDWPAGALRCVPGTGHAADAAAPLLAGDGAKTLAPATSAGGGQQTLILETLMC